MNHSTKFTKNAPRNARMNLRKTLATAAVVALLSTGLLIRVGATTQDFTAQAAGSLDTTFGTGGKVMTDLFGSEDDAGAMVIQPDGKFIVAGGSFASGVYGFSLARYNTDGGLDATFGTAGKAYVSVNKSGGANAIGLQQDGKIVVAGLAPGSGPNDTDFALLRFNQDGSLDTTFGAGGIVTTDFFGLWDNATGLAIQKDGRIVVAGIVDNTNSNASDFGLARYNPDGSLDPTFGVGGKVTTDFFGRSDDAEKLAIQADGRLVVAGAVRIDASNQGYGVARYNLDGSLDTSFGAGGKVTTKFADGASSEADALAIQADGKIIAAGGTYLTPTSSDFGLVRYNPDGSLDTSFGTGGKVTTDFFGKIDRVSSVFIQPDGKILASGGVMHTSKIASLDFGLARYNADGSLDLTFGDGGKLVTDFLGDYDGAVSAAIQQDGNIIVAGSCYHDINDDNSSDFALARYIGISAATDFALGFDQQTISGDRGTKVKVRININRFGGFSGNVTVTPPDLSEIGVIAKPPDPIATTDAVVVYKLKIKGGATTGPHQITFTGRDDLGREQTANLTLVIQ